MKCVDVAADAVFIGRDLLLDCVSKPDAQRPCERIGCYWRVWHGLSATQFRVPAEPIGQGELEL